MSGTKSPTVTSKHIRRRREKLDRRTKGYEEAIKRRDYVQGSFRKPGSTSVRKEG